MCVGSKVGACVRDRAGKVNVGRAGAISQEGRARCLIAGFLRIEGGTARTRTAPSVSRRRCRDPPPPPVGEGGKRRRRFASTGEAGGGVAMRSSVTEGAVEIDACALRDAFGVRADGGFGVGVEARNREEAAVHFERRLRARAAIVGRRFGCGDEGVEVEVFAREQLGCAAGKDLVAHPFALAEILPVVAPVGLEFRGAADAFEFRDLIEQESEPCDERSKRREPVVLGRGVVGLKRRSFEAHGRDCKCAGGPDDLRCGFPHVFCGKWLSVLEKSFRRPPNPDTRRPTK